ncbi:MAG: four helix bundle protein [Chitinophagaceae bacterium]
MSKELESRFLKFARSVRDFCKAVKPDVINIQYVRQLIRSSSSVGANYIEAADGLGKLDEKMKIKTSRREAKESVYWLQLILTYNAPELEKEKAILIDEGEQISKILSAILLKLR